MQRNQQPPPPDESRPSRTSDPDRARPNKPSPPNRPPSRSSSHPPRTPPPSNAPGRGIAHRSERPQSAYAISSQSYRSYDPMAREEHEGRGPPSQSHQHPQPHHHHQHHHHPVHGSAPPSRQAAPPTHRSQRSPSASFREPASRQHYGSSAPLSPPGAHHGLPPPRGSAQPPVDERDHRERWRQSAPIPSPRSDPMSMSSILGPSAMMMGDSPEGQALLPSYRERDREPWGPERERERERVRGYPPGAEGRSPGASFTAPATAASSPSAQAPPRRKWSDSMADDMQPPSWRERDNLPDRSLDREREMNWRRSQMPGHERSSAGHSRAPSGDVRAYGPPPGASGGPSPREARQGLPPRQSPGSQHAGVPPPAHRSHRSREASGEMAMGGRGPDTSPRQHQPYMGHFEDPRGAGPPLPPHHEMLPPTRSPEQRRVPGGYGMYDSQIDREREMDRERERDMRIRERERDQREREIMTDRYGRPLPPDSMIMDEYDRFGPRGSNQRPPPGKVPHPRGAFDERGGPVPYAPNNPPREVDRRTDKSKPPSAPRDREREREREWEMQAGGYASRDAPPPFPGTRDMPAAELERSGRPALPPKVEPGLAGQQHHGYSPPSELPRPDREGSLTAPPPGALRDIEREKARERERDREKRERRKERQQQAERNLAMEREREREHAMAQAQMHGALPPGVRPGVVEDAFMTAAQTHAAMMAQQQGAFDRPPTAADLQAAAAAAGYPPGMVPPPGAPVFGGAPPPPPPPSQPYVPRDPNAGPRVDSEPVWLYLELCERDEAIRRLQKLPLDAASDEVAQAEAAKTAGEQPAEKETEATAAEPDGAHVEEIADTEAPAPLSEPAAPAAVDEPMEVEPKTDEQERKDAEAPTAETANKDEPRATPAAATKDVPADPLPRHLIGMDKGRPVRHLGSWLYNPTVDPLFPAELLAKNVGATIEVRVSGDLLVPHGVGGPSWSEFTKLEREALERCQTGEPLQTLMEGDKGRAALEGQGNSWKLGWRGKEHARMSLEMRIEERMAEKQLFRQEVKKVEEEQDATKDKEVEEEANKPEEKTTGSSPWPFWRLSPLLRRKLWGTDVYTDDSDVLAMCVHAGWVEGPSLETEGIPAWVPPGRAARAWMGLGNLCATPSYQVGTNSPCDLSVILRIAPKLIAYKGCQRGGIKSRSWGNTHDGVSLVVESVELKQPGFALGKGRARAKVRIDQAQQLRLEDTILPLKRKHEENEAPEKETRMFWEVATV